MITLASDFGSPYPAAMKGAILRRSDARIVDVAHDFPRQDVRTAAFWLREVLPEFPPAVHCAVVDPGVGTDRDALVVDAGDHALVGPDNGLLLPVARRLASEFDCYAVPYDAESATFHGRDVFAPTAARVHEGGIDALSERRSTDPVDLQFPDPNLAGETATGEVLVVDGFGNAVTNLSGSVLTGRFGDRVSVNGASAPARRTYAAVDRGQRLVTVGSHGNVELAVNRGRGTDAFDVTTGDQVVLG